MKFGINTLLWGATFGPADFHRLPAIKAAGFDGIEVAILDPLNFPAAAIRRELEVAGLECTAVAIIPRGLGLGDPDATIRSRAQAHVSACIQQAAEAGANLLSGPMYSPVGYLTGSRRTRDEWDRAVESWQALAETTAHVSVDIGIEPLNRFETYFLNTASDGAAFCDAVGHPRVLLDRCRDWLRAVADDRELRLRPRRAVGRRRNLAGSGGRTRRYRVRRGEVSAPAMSRPTQWPFDIGHLS